MTRTESDWMELRKIEEIEFSDFLRTNPLCFDKNEYLRTYEAYSGVFGEDKILVLFFEDFERDLRNVVKKCFGFLDLDQDIEFDASVHSGKSSDCRVFSPGVRKLTESTFYRDLSIYIPGSLKASLKPLLARRKLIERPVWTDQDYQDFRARFEIKSTQFLKAVGQPSDYWSW